MIKEEKLSYLAIRGERGKKMNTYANIPGYRRSTLDKIVSLLIEEEDNTRSLFNDSRVEEFAIFMSNGKYVSLKIEAWVLLAIQLYNLAITQCDLHEEHIKPTEIFYMEELFLERFRNKLLEYSYGYDLDEVSNTPAFVSFGWDLVPVYERLLHKIQDLQNSIIRDIEEATYRSSNAKNS